MANWLIFSKVSEWPSILIQGFQYDDISNEDITYALANSPVIARIDTSLDWEDDEYLAGTTDIPEDQKHAHRVATLVHELRLGGNICNALEIDTSFLANCCSGVPNGHHRVRAMQFLGMDCGPFSLGGSVSMLEELVMVAGTNCPVEFEQYFAKSLLITTEDDIPDPTI